MLFVKCKDTFLNITNMKAIEIRHIFDETSPNGTSYVVEILIDDNTWYELACFQSFEEAEDLVKKLMESLSAKVITLD